MLHGIVFDLDGVVVNSHLVHREAWRRFLRTLGKEVSDAKLDFILEGRKRQDILRFFLGDLSDSELLDYGNRKDEFFREIGDNVEPVAGVIEFVNKLHEVGMHLAVATSASQERTRFTLRRLGLSDHFRAVVTGDDVAEGKPSPAVYQMAAQRLNLFAENLMAFEDAPCGVRAARSAGMRCIGIARGRRADALRRAGAQHVIPDFVGLVVEDLEHHFVAC